MLSVPVSRVIIFINWMDDSLKKRNVAIPYSYIPTMLHSYLRGTTLSSSRAHLHAIKKIDRKLFGREISHFSYPRKNWALRTYDFIKKNWSWSWLAVHCKLSLITATFSAMPPQNGDCNYQPICVPEWVPCINLPFSIFLHREIRWARIFNYNVIRIHDQCSYPVTFFKHAILKGS